GVTLGGEGHGFTINAGEGDLAAVYLVGNNQSVTVEGNLLDGGSGSALLTGGGMNDLLVTGNTLTADGPAQVAYNNGETSLGNASTDVSFIGNLIVGGEGAGLLLGIEASGATVTGNTFEGSSSYAMLELWSDGTVTGNAFDAEGGATAILDAGGHFIEGELVTGNTFANGAVALPELNSVATYEDGV